MDDSQIDFLNDFSQFMNTFNETRGAYGSGQNRAFEHAPPVHNRTQPCQTIIDHHAGGIDLDHPSYPLFHAPHVPWFPVVGFGAPTDLPQHDRQMDVGCSSPATNPVGPDAGNLPPPAFFAVDPRHIRGQPPSAIYPPLNFNQPCLLHQIRKAESNRTNVPSLRSLAKGRGSEMTLVHKQSLSRSPPRPSSAQVKSPSMLGRRGGKRRSRRSRRQTGAKAAPPATYNYQCLWGLCGQLVRGDRNHIRKHLKECHAVPVDETRVPCRWECTCREMRGDSIPRHIEKHLGVRWGCSKCDALFSCKDSGWRHTERHDGTDCAGADIYECPGPGAIYIPPDATSVLTTSSIGSYHPINPVT